MCTRLSPSNAVAPGINYPRGTFSAITRTINVDGTSSCASSCASTSSCTNTSYRYSTRHLQRAGDFNIASSLRLARLAVILALVIMFLHHSRLHLHNPLLRLELLPLLIRNVFALIVKHTLLDRSIHQGRRGRRRGSGHHQAIYIGHDLPRPSTQRLRSGGPN
jgi:hypothetical protein